jgi:ABC transporter substrate binding protein
VLSPRALADLGWTDGHNIRGTLWGEGAFYVRGAGGDVDRIRGLAQELVGLQPDIILASSIPVTVALQRETRIIPIVFVDGGDPVASGMVSRLDRPGGCVSLSCGFDGRKRLRSQPPKLFGIRIEVVVKAHSCFFRRSSSSHEACSLAKSDIQLSFLLSALVRSCQYSGLPTGGITLSLALGFVVLYFFPSLPMRFLDAVVSS